MPNLKPQIEGDHVVIRPLEGVEIRYEIEELFLALDIDPEFQSLLDLYLMRKARRGRKENEE